jgi:hypothetical protein
MMYLLMGPSIHSTPFNKIKVQIMMKSDDKSGAF